MRVRRIDMDTSAFAAWSVGPADEPHPTAVLDSDGMVLAVFYAREAATSWMMAQPEGGAMWLAEVLS